MNRLCNGSSDPLVAASNDAVPTAADEDIRPVIDGCQDGGRWGY